QRLVIVPVRHVTMRRHVDREIVRFLRLAHEHARMRAQEFRQCGGAAFGCPHQDEIRRGHGLDESGNTVGSTSTRGRTNANPEFPSQCARSRPVIASSRWMSGAKCVRMSRSRPEGISGGRDGTKLASRKAFKTPSRRMPIRFLAYIA